jgi:molecular chaperone DnaK
MKLIGIDLGTTNSAIALVNEFGKAEIIPNKEGERITPSVVLFDDDQIIVGSIAKQSSVAEPDRTVSSIKSQMGSSDFKFVYKQNEYKPEDISAMIIRKLIEDAESYLNDKITDVVITVPAYFNDHQRKATIDAGKISGINVTQIINEPTAAALTYGLDKNINQKIMVYDLGGGTSDVTIMKVNNSDFDVLASDGDRQLGGNNFDEKLMIYLNDKFKQQHEIDLFDDPVLLQDLRLKSENAKKVLTTKLSTTLYISAKGKSARITVTRKLFSDLIADFITRTELLINAVMTDAGLEWKDVDQILMVGGSTRIPAVHDMILRVTGKNPSTRVNPDEAVALGAAIQAGVTCAKDQNEPVNDMVRMKYGAINVSDVTAHSFGAITLDEFDNKRNAIIIPKNSKIPVRKSQIFYTSSANQTQVKMVVIQGEDPDPEFCTTIGTTTLDFPPKPENSPVIFNYEYDINGIIHATAKDPDTGKKSEIQIAREGSLTNEQINQKKGNLNTMFPRRREFVTTESFTEDSQDKASAAQLSKKDTGASLVNDVFVASGFGVDSESFDERQVYDKKIKQDSVDEEILAKSEITTITSRDLKREMDEEASIMDRTLSPDEITKSPLEEADDEAVIDNSRFIERFDTKETAKKQVVEEPLLKKESFADMSEDEQIEKIDHDIESMFDDDENLNKVEESTESYDETLDEIVNKSVPAPVETASDEPEEDELDDVFDSLAIADSEVIEDEEADKEIEEIKLADIEKKQDDDYENVSMEDSSVTESQSFDDELDEIGKSEFIIDRSEYLTDEDIIRIKEEGTFKSGVQTNELPANSDESFTEDEVNELFTSQDSKKVEKDPDKKSKKDKDDDISDWIDE